MPRHVAENVVQRPQFQWIVVGNGKMVFAALAGSRQPQVAARLAYDMITQPAKGLDKPCAGNVSWKPQSAMTSSRTK